MKAPLMNEMTPIRLARNDFAEIRNARGVLLRVQHGTVWLTQSGSTEDVVLEAGDVFRLDRKGLALVSACRRASHALVTIVPAAPVTPSSLAQRLWRLLGGPGTTCPSIGGTAVASAAAPSRLSAGATHLTPITDCDEVGASLDSHPAGRARPAGLEETAGASISCAPAT